MKLKQLKDRIIDELHLLAFRLGVGQYTRRYKRALAEAIAAGEKPIPSIRNPDVAMIYDCGRKVFVHSMYDD